MSGRSGPNERRGSHRRRQNLCRSDGTGHSNQRRLPRQRRYLSSMTIVLLSSDLAVLSRVEGAATRLGQSVRSANGESQAADLCKAQVANTLIVDLSMPPFDLAALVSQLKSGEGSG